MMNESNLGDSGMPDPEMVQASIEANMDTNLDDLFGETADGMANGALTVALPPAPLPSELALRIADMQNQGCCTKLAWSSTGCIAEIKGDGRKVTFRALIRNQKTGTWPLSNESEYPIVASEESRIQHIQFSNMGTDLAVVDNHGQVLIHTLTGPLGRMPLAPHNISTNEIMRSDANAVVGLHWLPVFPSEFKFPYITPAIKTGDSWKSSMHHRAESEASVHHPVQNRCALLYVSRDARLTLMYQIEAAWHAVDSKLEEIHSSNELLSHAAMCEDGETVLLVTHNIAKRFRLYKIAIVWNPAQQDRPGGGPPVMTVAPVLNIGRLTALDHVAAQHADTAELSQLHLVPKIASHVVDAIASTSPTILAVFSRASPALDLTQQHQEAFSVIARWHIEDTFPTLHEAFNKLKSGGPASAPQTTVTILRRQEDIITNRLILGFESQHFNTILAFAGSDGTVEFRERTTMASIEPYPDSTSVTSLPQSGFEYMSDEHYIHVTMSADASALATVRSDGNLGHKAMTLRYTWHPVMDDGGLIEAAVVCLARQYAILCCTSAANDETLALLPFDLSTELRSVFLKEVMSLLDRVRHIDMTMLEAGRQQITAMREPLLPKVLSAQFVLGCKPGTTKPTTAGKFAFAFLNMRLVGTSVYQFIPKADSPSPKAEMYVAISGLIRWGSDMLVYLLADLTAIQNNIGPNTNGSIIEAMAAFVSKRGSPVIQLLLCSLTRACLRFLANTIPKYLQGAHKAVQSAGAVFDRQQLMEIFERATSLPFKYTDLETFITEADTAVRDVYMQGNITTERRREIELLLMCCDAAIPTELSTPLETILNSALPKLMEKVDTSKLYFWDTSWLGIEPSPNAHQFHYDMIRKVPLTKGMKLRVCRRCGAVMEDLPAEKMREMPPMLIQSAKHCICANFWIVN